MTDLKDAKKDDGGAYHHRTAHGCWINDMRNDAMPHDDWPSVVFDEQTERDIIACLDLQQQAGFNEFDVFGLLVSHNWPLDIRSAVDENRRGRVNRILVAAHDRGIKVIYGLGVYSWGFDRIIERCPEVRGPNPHAMCGSKPESWRWMQAVVDYVLDEFDVDGLHLEASDLGRCTCPLCSTQGNVEYYSRLNGQTASYVRSRRPDKTLMVNMCGYLPPGRHVAEADWRYLVGMSRHLDYLIDAGHRGLFIPEPDRPRFIRELHCEYGTSGGVWVYPPQRSVRLRWFLPYTMRTWRHLRQLHADGGRATEYYMGPIRNPGVETNIAFGGRLLLNVTRSHEEVLGEVLETLYKPRRSAAKNGLVDAFRRAEEAYFGQWRMERIRETGPVGELHPIAFPPEHPQGLAVYLMDPYLDAASRMAYKRELSLIMRDISRIEDDIPDRGRIERIRACIRHTIDDIENVNSLQV